MNKTNIEAFIALLNEKNIVKAAESLYLSPSTVSTQLKVLENELGFKLFERHKGHKTVTLTPKGESFKKIAYDFLSLINECDQLKSSEEKNFNSIDMIYSLISKKEVDIGFVTYQINYPDVKVEEVFSDEMVVLVHQNSHITGNTIHPSNLDPEKELIVGSPKNKHIGCGATFNTWRATWIDAKKRPLVRVNSISVLYHFLSSNEIEFWMFAPMTTAKELVKEYNLRILTLEEHPPKRVCYKLTHRHTTQTVQKNIDYFNSILVDYIKEHFI